MSTTAARPDPVIDVPMSTRFALTIEAACAWQCGDTAVSPIWGCIWGRQMFGTAQNRREPRSTYIAVQGQFSSVVGSSPGTSRKILDISEYP